MRPMWQDAALLALVVGAVYANSMAGSFHYDDFHSLVLNPHIRSLANIPAFFSEPTLFSANPDNAMYRPLLLASFALNYALSGYEVWSYHLLSLALHLGCAYLVLLSGEILLQSRPAALLAEERRPAPCLWIDMVKGLRNCLKG